MAGTPKEMSKIKQLLLLHQQGVSNRRAALQVGMNKETANKYIKKAEEDKLDLKELLALPDPVLEYRFLGGNPAYSDPRYELLKKNLEYYRTQLKMQGVTVKLLWEEYRGDDIFNEEHYGLTQFRYHLTQLLDEGSTKTPSTILKDLYVPGEKIFFDFTGTKLEYIDIETGEAILPECFVACLPFSDYCFVEAVPSQKAEDFTYAISQCFKHLGGVTKIWVPDNLKAAVVKCDKYEPKLNRMLEDMANHYGSVVCPARPLHPKDKSQVEGQVRIIYQRIFAPLRNRTFYSLDELNGAIHEEMRKHNQKRLTGVSYTREEHFLAVEKPMLQPLPDQVFEIKCYTELMVQNNGCIRLGKDSHWYSVPYQHIGERVRVIFTRNLVEVYSNGECIATHVRDYRQGGYTIRNEHIASHCEAYRMRSSATYIERAARVSQPLETVIRTIFKNRANIPEEVFYKGCDGLLRLQKTTDPDLFNKACNAAISMDCCRYRFIVNLIESKCIGIERTAAMEDHPQHDTIRGSEQFS